MEDDFLSNDEHFSKLVAELPPQAFSLYHSLRYIRTETGFEGRHFIIYQMASGKAIEIDRATIQEYAVNTKLGTLCRVKVQSTGDIFSVGYRPVQLSSYPVVMYLPLYAKLRWAATPKDYPRGSLAFPIVVKTKTDNTNVRGVFYCSTGPDFARQFDPSFEG